MDRRSFFRHSFFYSGGLAILPAFLSSCKSQVSKVESYYDSAKGMTYRRLGKTGLMVSEIGLGGEWLERLDDKGVKEITDLCHEKGINILDIWMPGPGVRSAIGKAIKGQRQDWYIQGHIGSTWKDGQYYRTRDLDLVKPAFEDLLMRLETDYIDLGMIHYVDEVKEWDEIVSGGFLEYVQELKASGKIRHVGLSTHNVEVAQKAVESGIIEMMLFSLNPAYDMMATGGDIFTSDIPEDATGITSDRSRLYSTAETNDVGITVMKAYAGGRLLSAEASPFGVALTPVQCIHYALTRPAVGSALIGFSTTDHVLQATAYETAGLMDKDYGTVLANAPAHTFSGQCTYCGHCRPCTSSIDIAMVTKLTDLATIQDTVPDSVREHYKALERHGSDCLEDADCEARCPFKVKIRENMKKAVLVFGY